MPKKDLKITVIGAGAIGGIVAGFLAKAGYDVEVVCKHRELADKIASGGLHIYGKRGSHMLSVPAVARIPELNRPKDIIILAVKAADAQNAAKEVLPFLFPRSLVVPMENGMGEAALANIVGSERVVGCVIDWGATMHSYGELEMTATGKFTIGYIDGKPDDRLINLKKALSSILPAEVSENIMGRKYYKLVVNSCINSVGAICGLHLGEMFSIKKVRSIFAEIMREGVAVADAMGIRPEGLSDRFDYKKFLESADLSESFKRQIVIYMIKHKYKRLTSSSLQSLKRGRPTEVEYLNGYIADNAKRYNIPTPVNDMIVRMVKEIECGKRKVALDNLESPFFSRFA